MVSFLIAFVLLLVIGVPISISIGASAVLGCLSLGYPLVVIGQKMVSGIDSFLLIAVPLFILAGNLMNAGKITEKIFDTAKELVGWIPGGLGHANVVASIIFAGMSGSAAAGSCPHGKQLMTHSSEITARRQYVHFFLIYSSCHSGNVYEILYTILSIIAHSARDVKQKRRSVSFEIRSGVIFPCGVAL